MYFNLLFLVIAIIVVEVRCWVFNEIDSPNFLRTFDTDTDVNDVQARIALIYPGTNWCGAGNSADNYDDLGPEIEADTCCRDHDYCPDTIPGGQTKYNLTNMAFYTRLSCECDETFRLCLHSADTDTADRIGIIYFNALGTKCYRKDYPVTGCLQYGGYLNTKCIQYSYDTSSEPYYQWFDVPVY